MSFRRTWRTLAALGAGLVAALPAAAQACPQCAGRADGGIAPYVALGVFVTFPFAVAAVVARIVKRGDGAPSSSHGDPSSMPQPARRQVT